ncbi:cytochrome c biogenesis protein [Leptothoe spongobia]|uniref:Cytochrome c biogenesis protein CcsB n=1 Tax=Leptothoe spongobia TAU-MAC 1115 TaxID=1967444 RepID=A0A947DHN9_9CYAN|nr:cytochrome c biogenesis protein [Leptothoe spongobia]MBT9317131.1 cytochrome c biogenesis protein [Leptothoe spongobia TAU-MAC 1115]
MLLAVKRYFKKDLIPLLADLRLAIVLLLVIAVFSILGTVIEQGQGLDFYQQNYPEEPALFGFLSWKVLLTAGLDHVYRTWWYLSLLILFGSSLTACTFTRQITALRWFSRTWNFYSKPRQFGKMALSTQISKGSIDQLTELLAGKRYKTFHKDGTMLYAHKGLSGRIGPILVHASMLIILLGAMYGAMTGFFAQEMVPSGNTFTVQNVFDAGPWAGPQIPKDWSVKVNRFWIDYSPEGRVEQFYSDLSVLDDQGDEVKRKTVWVNEPLRYRNVTMYQADWSIAGVRVKVNNSPILQFPMAAIDTGDGGKLWGTWVPTKPDMSTGVSLIAKDLQGTMVVYSEKGELLSTVRAGMSVDVNGVTLSVAELIGSTGLQIKSDPGVPIVYLGFGLLMLGVVMSYISHSQVWALQDGDQLYVGGRTNRAQVVFERELVAVLDELSAQSASEPVKDLVVS